MENEYKKYFIEVDWKSESEDILYAIREIYGKLYNDIMEKNFDELAENYAKEKTKDFINALGQELSSKNLLLYEINKDSDSYVLIVVPVEEEDAFKSYLKNNTRNGEIKKQTERELGDVAQRIELASKIPCEKYSIPEGYMVKVTNSFIDNFLILYCKEHSPINNAILDISSWSPQKVNELDITILKCIDCGVNGKFALVRNNTLDDNGKLIDKREKIVFGYDLNNISEWKCLCSDLQIEVNAMIFFNDMLFLANHDSVYMVSDLKNFKETMIKILDMKKGDIRWLPKFFICDDTLYLYMHKSIYKFERRNAILKTGWKLKKIYTINGFNVENIEVIEDNKIAFQVLPVNLNDSRRQWAYFT